MRSGRRLCWCVLIGACLVACAPIWADGGFLGKRGDIAEPAQKAVLLHLDGVEDLVLQVQYDGAVDDFAWLVPLPSKPEVSAVDGGIFSALKAYTYERSQWAIHSLRGRGGYRGGSFGGPGEIRDEVTVYERKRVGIYDVAVLGSESLDGLVGWCTLHGYRIPDEAVPVLQSYVERGWIFTAMRIAPSARSDSGAEALKSGELQAMRFSFRSDKAIYPLRISSINRGDSDVLIYVLAEDTLIHPEFMQRHPAPLAEFPAQRDFLAGGAERKAGPRFSEYFDLDHFSYRAVAVSEVAGAVDVLPRWGGRKLYLTALQRTFEPKDMAFDITFKTPEDLDATERGRYVSRDLEAGRGPRDPLLLRMADSSAEVIAGTLTAATNRAEARNVFNSLDLLVLLEGSHVSAVLEQAARHSVSEVAGRLAFDLEDRRFHRIPANVLDDPVEERELCVQEHKYRREESFCHYHLEPRAGVSASLLEPALVQLFLREDPPEGAAKLLAALGSDAALTMLTDAARGLLDGGPVRRGPTRRTMALRALRHLKSPEVNRVIRAILSDDRESLTEEEILCCLVSLWNNPDGEAEGKALQLEALSRRKDMTLAAEYANRLLVNRLGTRQPVVEMGMTLAALEDALGGPGEVEHRMKVGEDEVIRFVWGAGVATVKSGVVVKWKPSGV